MRRGDARLLAAAVAAALLLVPLPVQAAAADAPAPHGDGFLLEDRPLGASRAAVPYGAPSTLPPSVDLREWAVTPGDQGTTDSCVSWAIGHSILGWYARKAGVTTTFAPMYVYSQTHLDSSASGGGSYVREAMNVVSSGGIDTKADYLPQGDFDFTTPPTAQQRTNAAPYRTLGYTRLFSTASGNAGTAGETAIKTALAAGTPVGVAVPIYDGFYVLDPSDSDFTLADATGSPSGYHYMAVLGYDATGITVQNSWGTRWGAGGFAHLGWDFVDAKAVEAEKVLGFSASTLPAATAPTPAPPTPTPTPTPTVTAVPTAAPSQVVPSLPPTTPVAPAVPTTTAASTPPTTTAGPAWIAPVTPAQATPPSVAPARPTSVAARSTTTSTAVTWARPATAAIAGYRVSITGGGLSTTRSVVRAGLVLRHLRPATAYRLVVRAVSSSGAISSATTLRFRTAEGPAITRLSSAHGVLRWTATAGGAGRIAGVIVVVRRDGRTIGTHRYGPSVRSAHLPEHGPSTATLVVRTTTGATVKDRIALR